GDVALVRAARARQVADRHVDRLQRIAFLRVPDPDGPLVAVHAEGAGAAQRLGARVALAIGRVRRDRLVPGRVRGERPLEEVRRGGAALLRAAVGDGRAGLLRFLRAGAWVRGAAGIADDRTRVPKIGRATWREKVHI